MNAFSSYTVKHIREGLTLFSDEWFHSDMKDMAYFYVYPLYDELKTKGSLK